MLQSILDHAAEKTAVLAMGNPYVAQDFPAIQNYLCTFSNASVSEPSAVKALFGEIAIHGHLPVSIPNIAQRGAGIERPRRRTGGSHRKDRNMRMPKLLDSNSPLAISRPCFRRHAGRCPACNVKVKKDAKGRKRKWTSKLPSADFTSARVRTSAMSACRSIPGARRKESSDDGDENSANVNISSNMFGLRVVAVEYLSNDPPEKIVSYYKDQLKKYGKRAGVPHQQESRQAPTMDPETIPAIPKN